MMDPKVSADLAVKGYQDRANAAHAAGLMSEPEKEWTGLGFVLDAVSTPLGPVWGRRDASGQVVYQVVTSGTGLPLGTKVSRGTLVLGALVLVLLLTRGGR